MSIYGLNAWVNEWVCEVWEAVKSALESYPGHLADQLGMSALAGRREGCHGQLEGPTMMGKQLSPWRQYLSHCALEYSLLPSSVSGAKSRSWSTT